MITFWNHFKWLFGNNINHINLMVFSEDGETIGRWVGKMWIKTCSNEDGELFPKWKKRRYNTKIGCERRNTTESSKSPKHEWITGGVVKSFENSCLRPQNDVATCINAGAELTDESENTHDRPGANEWRLDAVYSFSPLPSSVMWLIEWRPVVSLVWQAIDEVIYSSGEVFEHRCEEDSYVIVADVQTLVFQLGEGEREKILPSPCHLSAGSDVHHRHSPSATAIGH